MPESKDHANRLGALCLAKNTSPPKFTCPAAMQPRSPPALRWTQNSISEGLAKTAEQNPMLFLELLLDFFYSRYTTLAEISAFVRLHAKTMQILIPIVMCSSLSFSPSASLLTSSFSFIVLIFIFCSSTSSSSFYPFLHYVFFNIFVFICFFIMFLVLSLSFLFLPVFPMCFRFFFINYPLLLVLLPLAEHYLKRRVEKTNIKHIHES